MSYNTLPCSIQISKKRHWQLMRLVYAANENGVDPMEPARKPATLADEMVGSCIDRDYPELNSLWDQLNAIEAQASTVVLKTMRDL